MSEQINDVDAFFSEHDKTTGHNQQIMDGVSGDSNERNDVKVAGTYVCKVKTVVYKKKDETEYKIFPRMEVSSKAKVLQLHTILEVVDGTEVVKPGATAFYTLTLLQPPGAPDDKIQNTFKFMKPAMINLTGLNPDQIGVTSSFFKEYCTIDQVDGKVVRNHKLNQKVLAVVEEEWDPTSKSMKYRVKTVLKYVDGDKSFSVKNNAAASNDHDLTSGGNADMAQYANVKDVEIPQEKPSLAPADDDIPSLG